MVAAGAWMLISGLSELVTMLLLVPFLVALSGPDRLMTVAGMHFLASLFGLSKSQQLLLPLTLLLSSSALLGALLRSHALWINCRLAACIGHDLSITAYGSILQAEHGFLLERNSSDLIGALESIDDFISYVLRPLLQTISALLIALVVGIGLVVIHPALAILLALIASLVYIIVSRLASRRLHLVRTSLAGLQATRLRIQQESMEGIRHIRISGTGQHFLRRYAEADNQWRMFDGKSHFFALVPRYVIEGVGIVLLCTIAFFLFALKGAAVAIPTVGLLTLATQRFLPSVQEAYSLLSLARLRRYTLKQVLLIMREAGHIGCIGCQSLLQNSFLGHLSEFSHSIRFEDVYFSYPNGRLVFESLNLVAEKGARIAIVGPTGSGKSTLIDLLIGFQKPSKGAIWIDNQCLIDEQLDRRLSWQSQIAYVPQSVYLTDGTILENIAFGADADVIDARRVEQASQDACMESFLSTLPDGLMTRVGQCGSRLSGGQRQRIGIARALYQNKHILILDEPTNSLDDATEEAVIESLQALPPTMTIIVVTHSQRLAESLGIVWRLSDKAQAFGSPNLIKE